MIIVGKGARVLSEKEMKHVLGGQDDIIIGDLTACNNKNVPNRQIAKVEFVLP